MPLLEAPISETVDASRRTLKNALAMGSDRLELLGLELEEERMRMLHAAVLAGLSIVLALLATLTLTAFLVVLLWGWSPLATLGILSFVYALSAVACYRSLLAFERNRRTLGTLIDEFRKDCECLSETLS